MIAGIWAAMPWIIAACVVIWVLAVTAGILILLACTLREAWCAARDWWQDARAVIEETQQELSDQPVPYRPAEDVLATHAALLAALCWRCNDGVGACICSTPCPARACTGGWGEEDSSNWDAAWLGGLGIGEGAGQ